MKKYQKHNSAYYSGALVSILISTVFAVVLQFFKGDVLDHAIAGEAQATLKYAVFLIAFILGEILFYFGYRQCSARFAVGCARLLKRDIFESIVRRGYVDYKKIPQANTSRNTQTRRTPSRPSAFRCCRCSGRYSSRLSS